MGQFRLKDGKFTKIAPQLPSDTRCKERVDDPSMIIGGVRMLNPWALAGRVA